MSVQSLLLGEEVGTIFLDAWRERDRETERQRDRERESERESETMTKWTRSTFDGTAFPRNFFIIRAPLLVLLE